MEVLLGRESLAQQPGAANGSILVQYQAAVGFVAEERLPDSEDNERIEAAADQGENQGGQHRPADFGKEFFHTLKQV